MSLENDTVTRVIFVRHGQSDYNAQGRFQGSLDEPQLTSKGWKTALQCGQHLNRNHFDVIVCSPLRRARQTVESIVSTYGPGHPAPPVIYDARLREVHLPGWEGLPMQTVQSLFPASYRLWKQSPDLLVLPSPIDATSPAKDFSPLGDMRQRATEFQNDLLLHHRGQTVLVVGHGAAISVLIGMALNLSPDDVHCVQQSNGGISCLEFASRQDKPARACYINRTQHLGEMLPKMKEGRSGVRLLLLTEHRAARISWPEVVPGAPVHVVKGEGSTEVVSSLLSDADDRVRTVAWIQPSGRLSDKAASILLRPSWQSQGLVVEQDTLTVLHYPRRGCAPILQALNIDLDPETSIP